MATVKVFVPTYRRNGLLSRSVQSLLNQTFTDWVCEVHNDDPEDTFPLKYVNSLSDGRVTVVNHSANIGPVATFNIMFGPTESKYVCLLEDDNWWENTFLEIMISSMDRHVECSVGFSDINRWQEEPGNKWHKINEPLWPVELNESFKLISFPQSRHIFNYHHSNCSMIIRNGHLIQEYKVPFDTRVDFIEAIHERAFSHPLLFINRPLSNFALTINTSRQRSINGMYEHRLLLTDSFFTCVEPNDGYARQLWEDARQNKLRSYMGLLYTGLTCKASHGLLKYATLKEWVIFILYNIRHPSIFYKCIKAKNTYTELWEYLLTNTHKRMSEAKVK